MGKVVITKNTNPIQADLLWTNPNPTASSWAEQTITLNLKDYEWILIYGGRASGAYSWNMIPKNLSMFIGGSYTSDYYYDMRPVKATDTGIAFSTCEAIRPSYDSAAWNRNDLYRPLKIYGIKKIKLE